MSLRKRIKWEFEQGRQEQALQVYHNCLKRGMPVEEAVEISGVKMQ